MDEIRFDRLTRSLSSAGSRRRALAAVLGGSLGLLGWHADEDAVAHNAKAACKKKSGKAKKKCLKKAKKHNATHTVAAAPPPPPSDPCAACTAGQICQAGACQTCDVCPSGCTFTSVQAAINAIGPQLTTIQVCSGTYHGDLNITRDLTLTGAGDGADPATNTILDGTGTTSVVKIGQLSIVSIQDMRITGGAGASFGGGIRNDRGRLTVTDCTVAGNTVTDNGAGIDTTSGMTTLNGCTITDNEAEFYGGGIGNSGTTTLNGCTVSGNRAIGAGGIFNFSGTVTLNSSAVTNNTPDNCAPPIPGCTG